MADDDEDEDEDEEEEEGLSDAEEEEWYEYGKQAFQEYYDHLSDVTLIEPIVSLFAGSRFYKPPSDAGKKAAYDRGWEDAHAESGL